MNKGISDFYNRLKSKNMEGVNIMKKFFLTKKILSAALAAAMITGSAAVTVNAASVDIGSIYRDIKVSVPVNGSGTDLELNRTYELPDIVSGLTGNGYKISVDKNNVIKIQNGKITTVGTGSVTLTVTLKNGTKISKTFNVRQPQIDIRLNQSRLAMKTGQSQVLKAILSQSKAKVTWSSSDKNVVSVDQNGKITAKKSGTAVITAKSTSGKTASCTITVGDLVPVTKVNINTTSVKLAVGESYQLHTSVSPSNASDKSVKCTSANPKIASVSYAKITAKSVGTTTITVKSTNGKTAVCKVTVTAPVQVTKVNINTYSVKLKVGQTYQLHTSVSPSNALDKSVKCTSANPKIASVSYAKITAKSVGSTRIIVKSTNGKTAECKVTVVK